MPFIWAGKSELSDPMQRNPPARFTRLALARDNRQPFWSHWHRSGFGDFHNPRTVPDLARIGSKLRESFAVFLLLFDSAMLGPFS